MKKEYFSLTYNVNIDYNDDELCQVIRSIEEIKGFIRNDNISIYPEEMVDACLYRFLATKFEFINKTYEMSNRDAYFCIKLTTQNFSYQDLSLDEIISFDDFSKYDSYECSQQLINFLKVALEMKGFTFVEKA